MLFRCENVRVTAAELVEFCDWLLEDERWRRVRCYNWNEDNIHKVRQTWATSMGNMKTFIDPWFATEADRIEFMLRFADAIGRSEYRT